MGFRARFVVASVATVALAAGAAPSASARTHAFTDYGRAAQDQYPPTAQVLNETSCHVVREGNKLFRVCQTCHINTATGSKHCDAAVKTFLGVLGATGGNG